MIIFKATTMEHEPLQYGPDGLLPRKCQGPQMITITTAITITGQRMTITTITAVSLKSLESVKVHRLQKQHQ